MSEELVFRLLEEDSKARVKRIVEERRITTEDCLVIGILRLNSEVRDLRKEIDDISKRMNDISKRIDWVIGLVMVMWATIMAALIPILLKLVGVI